MGMRERGGRTHAKPIASVDTNVELYGACLAQCAGKVPYSVGWWQCFSWAELPFLHPFNEGERGNDGNPVRFRLGPQVVIRIATNVPHGKRRGPAWRLPCCYGLAYPLLKPLVNAGK